MVLNGEILLYAGMSIIILDIFLTVIWTICRRQKNKKIKTELEQEYGSIPKYHA